LHHQDCQVPTRLHATDDSSYGLCNRLLKSTDNAKCVLTDCESVVKGQSCETREAISFLKFYLLQQALAEMQDSSQSVVYVDATAMVQGSACYSELGSTDADVAASPELMLPGCPEEKLAPEVMNGRMPTGLNANTGVLYWRSTASAKAFLDALLADYEAHLGDNTTAIRAQYSACPEQAHFNLYVKEHSIRDSVATSWLVSTADAGDMRVTILDNARWPRFMVRDAAAYVEWPQAVQERVAISLESDERDMNTHGWEEPSFLVDGLGNHVLQPATRACLYHPFVPGNVTGTEGRGSQAEFFSRDGFWYL